ncbi:MmgE/PrpD family protein [Sesbania bispinosa]|nr:MmgE/PrpD family protein [Sesbania bispinosa]
MSIIPYPLKTTSLTHPVFQDGLSPAKQLKPTIYAYSRRVEKSRSDRYEGPQR